MKTKTIFEQIKNILIVYVKSQDLKNESVIISMIKSTDCLEELEKHVKYWKIHPYNMAPSDYITSIIENNYDATKDI